MQRDPREAEVLSLVSQKRDASELIAFYGRLAGDASATGVRSLALNALFSEESRALRLKHVLEAVAADDTPPREDPLWPALVTRLSQEWTPDVFDKGRDLMLMEKRPRARRALVESFAEIADNKAGTFTPEQGQALLTDLIDIYPQADPDQKPTIQAAVRELGGDDTANLLGGRGLAAGDKLQYQAEYERQLARGAKALLKDPPNVAELNGP